MAYRLLKELGLDEAKTTQVNLIATSRYFKPVIVLTAPLTRENAELLKADWAFDKHGNPNPFDGAIKLPIDITDATVTFHSNVKDDLKVPVEKIGAISVYREEKTGMRIRIHVHLPDGEDRAVLHNTLDYFASMNKEPFSLRITPDQGTLFGGADAQKSGDTPIVGDDTADVKHFRIMNGRRPAIIGSTTVIKKLDGYIAGWEVKGLGLTNQPAGGEIPTENSPRFDKAGTALHWAASEVLSFVKNEIEPANAKEIKAVAETVDWCIEVAPALSKDEHATQ